MRVLILSGHTRPITEVMVNRDGDLLFSSGSDSKVMLWDVATGERLGTYDGHGGAVFDFDVDFHSQYMISGSGDGTVKLWSVENGKNLYTFDFESLRVRSVDFAVGERHFLAATPKGFGKDCSIHILRNPVAHRTTDDDSKEDENNSYKKFCSGRIGLLPTANSKGDFMVNKAKWAPTNEEIICCCSDGTIRIIDVNKEVEKNCIEFDPDYAEKAKAIENASPSLTDIKFGYDYSAVVITSRNTEARMYDMRSLCKNEDVYPVRIYKSDRSLNTAAMHPSADLIGLGGGKEAMQAALDKRGGKYECLLYHSVFEEKMGLVPSDCFSPLNAMTFTPDGSQFILGYEEGQIRVYQMEKNFASEFSKMEKRFTTEEEEASDNEE